MASFLILLMVFMAYLILYVCKYLPACLSLAMCMPSARRGQKMVLNPLELERRIAM